MPATFAFGAVPSALRSDATMTFGLEANDKTYGDAQSGGPKDGGLHRGRLLTFDQP